MTKKILSVVIALCCVLSVTVVAFSADADTTDYNYLLDPLVNLKINPSYEDGYLVNAIDTTETEIDEDTGKITGDVVFIKDTDDNDGDGNTDEDLLILGAPTTAMYHIIGKEIYALNNVPTETETVNDLDKDGNIQYVQATQDKLDEDGNPIPDEENGGNVQEPVVDEEGNPVYTTEVKTKEVTCTVQEGGDSDSDSVYWQGVIVSAYYATECPCCHQVTGGYSFFEIYNAGKGCCAQCGYKFPSPSSDEMKFYRFIVVNEDSDFYAAYKGFDFTLYSDDLFGSSEKYYGDGEDLPQSALLYEQSIDTSKEYKEDEEIPEILSGIDKDGDYSENDWNSWAFNLLTKIEYWLEPVSDYLAVSRLVQFRTNILDFVLTIWNNILVAPFTKIL